MAAQNDILSTSAALPLALSEAALRRYLRPELVGALLGAAPSPRTLAETFAQLASARYAIGTYLPRHLVTRQIATDDTGPWLEWVEGSLLFADVSGSTALAERLAVRGREGTEIVTGALNAFFDTMIQVIQAAGGDLLTFGGDALLVLFSGPQHAHVATWAALELLQQLSGFERSVPGTGTFSLSMHIGVESGRVALASAGQADSLHYSAMGSIVNSVARAEGYGGKGELVVGPQTWAAIAADAVGEELAPGYLRVSALRARPNPAPLPGDEPLIAPPAAAIPRLLQQLDRISPYLPSGLLTRIVADPQRPQVEADLRPVTVLFAQVVGLGPLVEELAPEQAAAVLDIFLRPMEAAVERFGGVINKLDLADEGDKILAIFGAPVAYEDHAERAARAALMVMQEAFALRERGVDGADARLYALTARLRLRIGLNTGSVFAGNVGTASRKEYTVMGDAVNVAARVMAQTPWGEIWCSATTAAKIAHRLECADRGRVRVKGKSEPLPLLRVLNERVQATMRGEEDQTPLVGRQAELAWLRAHLDAACAGQGRVLRISGEAGVGKSRLTTALLDAARAAGMRILPVACLSYATNTPYAPWGEWLKELCGIQSGDPQEARAEKLRLALAALPGFSGRSRSLGSSAEQDQAREWLPLLADLVRLDVEDSQVTRALDPQQRQARRFELITALLRAAAARGPAREEWPPEARAADRPSPGPLLVLFEDLHWADQISLDLWQHVARQIDDVPVLLLGVHRPQLAWGSGEPGDDAQVLNLEELSVEDSHALLEARLGELRLPTTLRDQLVARAAGNPLFLEELLRALLATSNGDVTVATLDELPDSLNELLLARIDRLDEKSRSLLRIAAVIGQRFPFSVLSSLQEADQDALMRQLATLDANAFTVLERETPERVDTFRHALLQEVVYQSLLYARRRELHRRIGEFLERRYAEDVRALQIYYAPVMTSASPIADGRSGAEATHPAKSGQVPLFLLAHHYRLSDRQDKAVMYLLLAGHVARDAYANDEAIQFYRWVLEALREHPDDPRIWEAREALGDVLCTIGMYDEALAEYEAILATDAALLPAAVTIEALRSRGYALEKQGQYAAALDELVCAEALVRANLDDVPPLLFSAVYADMASVLMRRGEYDRALEVCTQGLKRLRHDRRTREDERIEARLHTQIGMIYGARGDYVQANFHFENALAAHEEIDNLHGCSIIHNNIGYLWQLQSDYERALTHYRLAEALAQKINAKYMLSFAHLNIAYANHCLGRFDAAEAGCHAALALCEEMRDQSGIARVYGTYGDIAYHRGDYAAALEHYERALALHREQGSSHEEGSTQVAMALVYNALARADEAQALAAQALATAERLQASQLKIEALNAQAESALLRAEPLQRIEAWAQEAATLAEGLGSKRDHGVALRLLGEASARAGRPFDAQFLASLAVFDEIKNRFELARTQATYAQVLAFSRPDEARAYREQALAAFMEIGARGALARLSEDEERSP